jgi:tryptophan-rich sensory protein
MEAVLPVVLTAAAGSVITSKNKGFSSNVGPPPIVFTIVWTIIYLGIIIAALLVPRTTVFLGIFYVQLLLNLLWVQVFFGDRDPGAALIVIALLFISICGLIWYTWGQNKAATFIFVLYGLWVVYAASLNWKAYQRK